MLNWTAKGVAEAIGLMGIVASLVFVGLEVRQNSVATRASTNAAVADAFIELNLVLASSPDLSRAVVVSFEDPGKLSPEDRILVLGMWRTVFHVWSNAHRQWTNETLDEVLYESIISEISTYGRKKDQSVEDIDGRARSMRWAWESERFIFNREFQEFVDELIGAGRDGV
jgi:hypothetical protein